MLLCPLLSLRDQIIEKSSNTVLVVFYTNLIGGFALTEFFLKDGCDVAKSRLSLRRFKTEDKTSFKNKVSPLKSSSSWKTEHFPLV